MSVGQHVAVLRAISCQVDVIWVKVDTLSLVTPEKVV